MSIAIVSLLILTLTFCGSGILKISGITFENSFFTLSSSLTLGSILSCFLVMTGLPLTHVLILVGLFALVSLISKILLSKQRRALIEHLQKDLVGLDFLACVFLIITLINVFQPLAAWDGLSIWFFKAKIMFFEGSLNLKTFAKPELDFAHADYPILIPSLSTLYVNTLGYWNEYLPKLVLIIPVAIAGLALWPSSNSLYARVARLIFLLAVTGEYLTNGYVDAHLALIGLAGISQLYLPAWEQEDRPSSLVFGLLLLVLACYVKTEGAFVVLSALVPLAIFRKDLQGYFRKLEFRKILSLNAFLLLAVASVPWIFWRYLAREVHLPNDMADGFALSRVFERLQNPNDIAMIAKGLLVTSDLYYAIMFFAVGLLIAARVARTSILSSLRKELPYLVTIAVYTGLLSLTYISTYWDLKVHLDSSVLRVMKFPFLILVWRGSYFFFDLIPASSAPLAERA